MPDPKELKVGDHVRFISLPDEWNAPEFMVHDDSVEFMKTLIARGRSSCVYKIDEWNTPWIRAHIRVDGVIHYHNWAISEKTGWRKVVPIRT